MKNEFAKIFNIGDTHQVLIHKTLEDGETHGIKAAIAHEGMFMSTQFDYETEEDRDQVFNDFSKEGAKSVMNIFSELTGIKYDPI